MKRIVTSLIFSAASYIACSQNDVRIIQANNRSTVRQVNNAPVVIIPKSHEKPAPAPSQKENSSHSMPHQHNNGHNHIKRVGSPSGNQQKKELPAPLK